MKLSSAANHYDYLAIKVDDGQITVNTMQQVLQALVAINKTVSLKSPVYTYNQSNLVCRWRNDSHILEVEFSLAGLWFRYRSIKNGHCGSPWSIGQEIPYAIADKLKFFAEK